MCIHTWRQPLSRALRVPCYRTCAARHSNQCRSRQFHLSRRVDAVKPFLLADIGEGITECQLIQWFVQPGARVEQFDKLCEVQSDKASVEITSPFDGVIKKLHYEPDDMAITGKPLVDIDIQGELSPQDEAKLGGEEDKGTVEEQAGASGQGIQRQATKAEEGSDGEAVVQAKDEQETLRDGRPHQTKGDHRSLATPAVRHLTRELKVDLADVEGTGKDGRVLKEDVHRFASQRDQRPDASSPAPAASKEDRRVPLTPVQNQMFKVMTRSLNIPHFLYTCAADMSAITSLRTKLNATCEPERKTTHLAFIIKALSMALLRHPMLNATLDTRDAQKPELTYRGKHHIGLAIDTPAGLLVPVLRDVQDLSIAGIAAQTRALAAAARRNQLPPGAFGGATFTVSNIGSVGSGGVVAPVISAPQVGILGVGRSRVVPAFDALGAVVPREELVLSWSADHRVVDGAECARCAERVKSLLEEPAAMLVELR